MSDFTPDQIKLAIKHLPDLSVDELAHCYKCSLQHPPKLFKAYTEACLRELSKRRKTTHDSDPSPDDCPPPEAD